MRFLGVALVLGSVALVSLVFKAAGIVVCPVYFLGVLGAVFGVSLMAYGFKTTISACSVYWGGCEKSPDEYALYGHIHRTARRTAVAAGILGMLIGTAATIGSGAPDVKLFARSLSAPAFGILVGYLWHEPMAAWFKRKSGK